MTDYLRVTQGGVAPTGQTKDCGRSRTDSRSISIWIESERPSIVATLLETIGTTDDMVAVGRGDTDDADGESGATAVLRLPSILIASCETADLFDPRRLQRLARRHLPARVLWIMDSAPTTKATARVLLGVVSRGFCHGYVLNADPVATWMRAVRAVAAGDIWLPRSLLVEALAVLETFDERRPEIERAEPSALTQREQQICDLVCAGHTNKEIGRRLAIAEDTVKKHLQHAYAKIGIRRRAQLRLRDDAY